MLANRCTHREAERHSPDIDEYNLGELGTANTLAWDKGLGSLDSAHNPHANGHDAPTDNDHALAAEPVHERHHGNKGSNEAHHTIHASRKEFRAVGRKAHGCEDARREVVDSVRTGHLEEDH